MEKPQQVICWIRNVDDTLINTGWQETSSINPGIIVFLYMLIRDNLREEIDSNVELKEFILACLFITYSYMVKGISYPLYPFRLETEHKNEFWPLVLLLNERNSVKMLDINVDYNFFIDLSTELLGHSSLSI